jgi:hypothetical protein
MQLPTIEYQTYTVPLLSRKEPVRIRPFLVKEQKLLLMAVEAKEIDATISAVKQVIKNCVLDPIDVDELPLADLEILFLNLRARSLGEVINLFFKCTNMVPDASSQIITNVGYPLKQCGMVIEVPVNLLQIPVINKDAPLRIMITKDVGLKMKYPSISMIDKLVKAESSEVIFAVIASCIDQIFDATNVYKAKDATQEELIKFVEELPAEKYELLEQFIENVPKTRFETKKTCTKCGYDHDFILEGLSDFFD